MNIQQLENELWEAADQLRANSKLTAAEYSMPVLGLIFLRHADNRFQAVLPEIEKDIPPQMPAVQREEVIKLGFQGKAAVYLPEAARFSRIVDLPQGEQVGTVIDEAMDAIEAEHEVLKGALPRGYTAFEPGLLAELVKIFDRPAIKAATGDVFGRIYEYFLNKFAMTGAQEGGEFFTPPSLVRMIVNVIEPDHGVVLDPACGSAGMFVQTSHFIEDSGQPDAPHPSVNDAVIFHGQEKSDINTRLARMNMVVHGLDATHIRQGNTFYDPIEHLIGGCDFVMANPPFNVDGVDTKRVEGQVGELGADGVRLPFGLPGTNGKTGAISNANSLWVQYFYAYLNDTGRAGFVMASSASDAGNKDREIREKLVKTGHVDAMVAIGNKFFYTRSLPCTLWFFDKGKPEDLLDQVLMVDARNVYTVVSARSHVFTDEQLANLNAIVWLYRGESDKFVALLGRHQQRADDGLAMLPARLAADTAAVGRLGAVLRAFADGAALADLNADPEDVPVTPAALAAFKADLAAAEAEAATTQAGLAAMLAACAQARAAVAATGKEHKDKVRLQATLEALGPQLKAAGKTLEARHKVWLKLQDTAEKGLRARLSKAFDGKAAREAKRALLAADGRRGEAPTVRDEVLEALKQAVYFIHQGHWLHSRFPNALFERVPGLCTVATLEEIKANDYSLTPGRYVGVAAAGAEDEDDFAEKLREIHDELTELNDKAAALAARIAGNFEEFLA
ncbi:hsdM2 protein [Sphaerotilus natans subsp. natans DSM 6575]|uniref:site-specific DNA-methyltransferase (adenine-specific) n=1 Tax=Sphaerotilus natans subsp. natans DSM 6575 TaxID=1286631 RepID=A0A059KJS0_9BURK|nr:class I SAM-dependent DNA methyltransferase [Sphaerotilus natans]KDB51605.1 hsdM2 protein [Sphaerotilus natans subsp. natans DSM 6575]SIR37289.1 type I restriction enzyme M protein [Sphaerotilus natans]